METQSAAPEDTSDDTQEGEFLIDWEATPSNLKPKKMPETYQRTTLTVGTANGTKRTSKNTNYR